jgi:hypothetical protein
MVLNCMRNSPGHLFTLHAIYGRRESLLRVRVPGKRSREGRWKSPAIQNCFFSVWERVGNKELRQFGRRTMPKRRYQIASRQTSGFSRSGQVKRSDGSGRHHSLNGRRARCGAFCRRVKGDLRRPPTAYLSLTYPMIFNDLSSLFRQALLFARSAGRFFHNL